MSKYEEFTEVCEYYAGVIVNGEPYHEIDSFANIEHRYFEGYNTPIKIIKGEREPSKDAYARMKRYYSIDMETRNSLRIKK